MKKKLFDLSSISETESFVELEDISSRDIAIIGMALRMPGADSPDQFWKNIKDGIDSVVRFPESRRKDIDRYLRFIDKEHSKVNYENGGYLDEIDKFDYSFFRMSPKEASLMDPNQRLFLQVAWEAIENAGYGGEKLRGSKTGVYVGFNSNAINTYGQLISKLEPTSIPQAVTGNISPVIASRISFVMDFRGPSMIIDTACSSSLVAVNLACQALKNSVCDYAIAGGIKIRLIPVAGEVKIGIESSDGRARTFDDSSDGTGWGEGVVALLLKPLSKAVSCGDYIHAVIKGSEVNQDGSSIGITAPNVLAQEDLIARAWKDADINPETITYIEAHGTGTKLGDPIEIDGIRRAFERYTQRKQFCAIGSVKTNIGHLDNAAGLAGLVKAVMALKNKQIPPLIHFRRPNRKINFEHSPVYVNTKLINWEVEGIPRRCGVSAFGLSGTNCHVVLEEAPQNYNKNFCKTTKSYIFAVSAKSENALKQLISSYNDFLENTAEIDVPSVCYTANTGRGHYTHRLAMIIKDGQELKSRIKEICYTGLDFISNDIGYFGVNKVVSNKEQIRSERDITETRRDEITEEAKIKTNKIPFEECDERKQLLHELCVLYIKGADIGWECLYMKENKRRVVLPVYQFEPKRCWIESDEMEMDLRHPYYLTQWKVESVSKENKHLNRGTVLLFRDEAGISDSVCDILRKDNRNIIEVFLGKEFEKIDNNRYIISGDEEDYRKLISSVSKFGISDILHLMTINKREIIDNIVSLELSQKQGVYSLFYLTRAILNERLTGEINMLLVSDMVNEVTGNEKVLKPENATFFGLAKVVGQEYPQIKCKCLDIDEYTKSENILFEFEQFCGTGLVALRNGDRYTEEFEKIDINSIEEKEFNIKKEGVYIVFGGAGGIGLELGKYLAQKNRVNICLVNRSIVPEVENWDEIIRNEPDSKLSKRIRGVKEIEKLGSTVKYYKADVSSFEEVKDVLNDIRNRFGKIDGIIHSAGVAGNGFIIRKSEEMFKEVLSAKVYGTWIIDHLTQSDDLDFLILCSSINSLLGLPGQGDYTAANVYMDSYSFFRNKKGKRTIAINWATWKETGMAVDFGVNHDNDFFKAISTSEAINYFENIMQRDVNRLILGEINFEGEFIKHIDTLPLNFSDQLKTEISMIISNNAPENACKVKVHKHKDLKLKGKDSESYSDIEKQVAEIWRQVLGFEELDIHENFFEIGGDSIMLTKVHALIEQQFPGKVKISDLFSNPTISSLSHFISFEEISSTEVKKDKWADIDYQISELFDAVEKGSISVDKASEIVTLWRDEDE